MGRPGFGFFVDFSSRVFGGFRRFSEALGRLRGPLGALGGPRRLPGGSRRSPEMFDFSSTFRRRFRRFSKGFEGFRGFSVFEGFRRFSVASGGFRRPLEALGGPRRLPRGSRRSPEMFDFSQIFRRFWMKGGAFPRCGHIRDFPSDSTLCTSKSHSIRCSGKHAQRLERHNAHVHNHRRCHA